MNSWTIKEARCQKIDHFQIVVKTLEILLDFHKEVKPVNTKVINPEYSLEGLILKQFHVCPTPNVMSRLIGKIYG